LPFGICESSTGKHSSVLEARKSDLEEMGLGISCYFKTLKYFSYLFFFLAALAIPLIIIFYSGRGYDFGG